MTITRYLQVNETRNAMTINGDKVKWGLKFYVFNVLCTKEQGFEEDVKYRIKSGSIGEKRLVFYGIKEFQWGWKV